MGYAPAQPGPRRPGLAAGPAVPGGQNARPHRAYLA
jgi:hypothetical protein